MHSGACRLLPVVHGIRIHIVPQQPVPGHIAPFRAAPAVIAVWVDRQPASWKETAPHFDIPRIEELDQVIHDEIHTVFMEIAVVAVAEKIELQGLALYNEFVRDIGNVNRSKIGLARLRAEARKFRAVELDKIIPVRVGIGHRFQQGRIIIKGILRLLAPKERQLVQAFSFFCHHDSFIRSL